MELNLIIDTNRLSVNKLNEIINQDNLSVLGLELQKYGQDLDENISLKLYLQDKKLEISQN